MLEREWSLPQTPTGFGKPEATLTPGRAMRDSRRMSRRPRDAQLYRSCQPDCSRGQSRPLAHHAIVGGPPTRQPRWGGSVEAQARPAACLPYHLSCSPALAEIVGDGRPWTVLMISLLSMRCR